MRIRLVCAWDQRINQYEFLAHKPGAVVDVDEDEARRLIDGGSAVDADAPAPVTKQAKPEPAPAEPEQADDAPRAKEFPKKPNRAASKAEWVAYAEKIGAPTKAADGEDMTRGQLIVAVEDYLATH